MPEAETVTVPAVKRRVRATPDAKRFRIVRVDIPSPANPSELNDLRTAVFSRHGLTDYFAKLRT